MTKKPGRGRPNEGRKRIEAHVLPETEKKIRELKDKTGPLDTIGKVIDAEFAKKPKPKKPK